MRFEAAGLHLSSYNQTKSYFGLIMPTFPLLSSARYSAGIEFSSHCWALYMFLHTEQNPLCSDPEHQGQIWGQVTQATA